MFAHARDAEEVRLGAGGHDQVVEAERGTVLEHECTARVVQPGRLTDAHAHVGLPAEDRAERGADFLWRQVAGADLVEQRLERVIVVAVDDRDVSVGVTQRPCHVQAREARTDDQDPRAHRPASLSCRERRMHVSVLSPGTTVSEIRQGDDRE